MERCAGLDWAKDAHRVCVLEGDGEPLLQRGFTHDERDLDGMCELLVESEVKRVAIERPDGVVVERLLQAGLVVLPIHPNQLKAARPRFRASGGKSDSFDAFCLAEPARTDGGSGRMSCWEVCELAWRRGWLCATSASGSTTNSVDHGWLSPTCWDGELKITPSV